MNNSSPCNHKTISTTRYEAVKVSRGFNMQSDLLICNNLFLSLSLAVGIYQVNGKDLDKVALWMTTNKVGKCIQFLFVFNDTKRIALRIKILCHCFAENLKKKGFRTWLIVNSKKLTAVGRVWKWCLFWWRLQCHSKIERFLSRKLVLFECSWKSWAFKAFLEKLLLSFWSFSKET